MSENKVETKLPVNIDELLDLTLDDLEDLPEFKTFPPGSHRCFATMCLKEVNKSQCVELSLKGIETLELAYPTKDTPIKEGDISSCLFALDNEFGRGKFKLVAKPLAEVFGTKTTRELIETVKSVEVVVITKLKKDKNDPDRFFLEIKELGVV